MVDQHPTCGSPLGVTLLMQAHFSPEPIGNGSAADRRILRHLVDHELIQPVGGDKYQTTEKGAFHVKALTQLPFPEAISTWKTPTND